MTTIFLFDEAVAARAQEGRITVLPSVTPAAARKKSRRVRARWRLTSWLVAFRAASPARPPRFCGETVITNPLPEYPLQC